MSEIAEEDLLVAVHTMFPDAEFVTSIEDIVETIEDGGLIIDPGCTYTGKNGELVMGDIVIPIPPQPPTHSDAEVLDKINELLSAPRWPGSSGLEDICALVRRVRLEIRNAPEWESH